MSHDHRIAVVHFTAPTCWWSWGYESVFNRLRLVYGDQINTVIMYGAPYEDIEEHKKNYGLDDAGMLAWAKESRDIMGVPMFVDYRFDRMPKNLLPATFAVVAGNRQGEETGHRLYRALLRRNIVEFQDVTQEAAIFEAVREAGLDEGKFKRDWEDQIGLKAELEKQGENGPSVHVGFYNFAVTDGHGRTVYLDQQFQPSVAEGAIDYLTEGKLKKTEPRDILAYLRVQGSTPTVEVERVFNLTSKNALAQLEQFEKAGKVKRSILADATFWSV